MTHLGLKGLVVHGQDTGDRLSNESDLAQLGSSAANDLGGTKLEINKRGMSTVSIQTKDGTSRTYLGQLALELVQGREEFGLVLSAKLVCLN